ncbi:MAG: cytochrome c [Terriglobales bacterium]
MRRVDILAFIGMGLLTAGAGTFLNSYNFLPLWIVWLVGPLLWYLGFAVIISWLMWRLFVPLPEQAEQDDVQQVRSSNFHEHDYDYEIPLEPKMRKVPVLTVLVVLILLSSVFLVRAYAGDNPAGSLFSAKCAMCHGADAHGKTAMGAKLNIKDLVSPEVQKQSDAELAQIITKGKNKMPAYDGKLTKDEVTQLTAYLRTIAKK